MKRRRGSWLSAMTVCVALASSNTAVAAPESENLPSDPKARELLDSGRAKFEAEDYEGALEDWQASYDRERHPMTLGALAQATTRSKDAAKPFLYIGS